MKAILIAKFVETVKEVKISEVPTPEPKDDEVLIRIAAAGVNFVDLLYARGKHQNNRSLITPPFILGLEFAGTVISSPCISGTPSSSSLKVGTRVFGGSLGSYASHITCKPSSLLHIPDKWTFTQAASLAATAPVSYGALILRGRLQKGETVLIHAAAGGLGLMAVQIAKAVGARVIATASTTQKLEVARGFGADKCVDYSDEGWVEEVLRLSEGKGVHVVFDPVGLVGQSLNCLRQRGRILVVGFAGREGDLESVAMNRVLLRQAQIIGYRYGETDRIDPAETARTWQELKALWESGKLKPSVYEKEYRGLESVVHAMKDLESKKVWGKAVIVMEHEDRPKL
ncbi:related to quinone reductase [Rhynchosporium secalis]|uniref:Related to quinone reductase n=1 Tax=Rhynchosporium secalis TaxID=38038 RepID=A0A1E1M625_RHYSE|nr:related to quinone reductase [Rhynchosporium secalis]